MGVSTTADKKIQEAKEKLLEVRILLSEVTNPSTWGIDDYKDEYVDALLEVQIELLRLMRKI